MNSVTIRPGLLHFVEAARVTLLFAILLCSLDVGYCMFMSEQTESEVGRRPFTSKLLSFGTLGMIDSTCAVFAARSLLGLVGSRKTASQSFDVGNGGNFRLQFLFSLTHAP